MTGQDYIVVRVMDQKRLTKKPLEALREEIKENPEKRKKEIMMQEWITDLKRNAVEIDESYLR